MNRWTIVVCIATIAATLCSAQNFRGSKATFDAPVVPVSTRQIRIVFRGSNFSDYSAFRLTQNTTNCNQGSSYTVGATPPGTISNIVYWTKNDPSSFFVALFTVHTGTTGAQVKACFTRDGSRWYTANNNRGRSHFHLWSVAPTISSITPPTPIAGQRLEVRVNGLLGDAVGALVTRRDGCDGTVVANALKGANFTKYTGTSFVFTPTASSNTVYLCVATNNKLQDWSLVPYDPNSEVKRTNTPSQPATGVLPAYSGNFTVNPSKVAYLKGEVQCGSMVAGAVVTCVVRVFNKTAQTLSPSQFGFRVLTDGGNAPICPLPTFSSVTGSTTRVSFNFMPQRSGRGGSLGLTYFGVPLFLYTNPLNDAYYAVKPVFNQTARAPAQDLTRDQTIMRFIVQPGFSDMHVYAYQSLLNFAYFNPSTNWVFTKGVPTFVNGSTGQDVVAATLSSSVTSGSMSRSTSIPTGSTMCRMFTKYFYSAEGGPDYTQTALIGTILVTVGTVSYSTVNLYASGTRVGVIGSMRRGNLVGDMRSWETVGIEFPVNSSTSTVTLTLSAYHGSVSKLYYSGAQLRCSSAVQTPKAEVSALQRIWTYVGQFSPRLASWRDGTVFNGDPCVNHWQGIVCRNMRVVEINLDSAYLQGRFPQVQELNLLERLSLRNNSLIGGVPSHIANLTALRYVDFSLNQFSAIPSAVFSAKWHVCLTTIIMRGNALKAFPAQVQGLPRLQHLDLARNAIVTSVPSWPSTSPLVHLDLSNNYLRGAPPKLPEQYLVTADFSGNVLNGTIPTQWANCQRLKFLDVSTNQLSGTIPLQLSLIPTASMATFRAADNFFTGYLPNLGFLTVDVRDNVFKCPLPIGKSFLLTTHTRGYDAMQCDAAQ